MSLTTDSTARETAGLRSLVIKKNQVFFICVSEKHEAERVEEKRLCAQTGARKDCTVVGSWSREDGGPAGKV